MAVQPQASHPHPNLSFLTYQNLISLWQGSKQKLDVKVKVVLAEPFVRRGTHPEPDAPFS